MFIQWIKKKLKDETGASQIVEMTIIFPIVIFVMGALIYLGCYVVQGVSMYTYAQRMAVYAAREISYPGYEKLGNMTQAVDFVAIQEASVNTIFAQSWKPYRFLSQGNNMIGNKNDLESNLRSLVSSTAFIKSGAPECSINVKNNIFNQKVTVTISKGITVPSFMVAIGVPEDSMKIHVGAVAVTLNATEFVRNTDFVFDCVSEIIDNTPIKGYIENFKAKFNNMRVKMGIEVKQEG